MTDDEAAVGPLASQMQRLGQDQYQQRHTGLNTRDDEHVSMAEFQSQGGKEESTDEEQEMIKETRERIIKTVHDFVMFMRDLYIPDDQILIPPPGGWPQINKESFAVLEKDDCVIEVLRHLTYIEMAGDWYVDGCASMWNWSCPRTIRNLSKEDLLFTQVTWDEPGCQREDETAEQAEELRASIGLKTGSRNAYMAVVSCKFGYLVQEGYVDEQYFDGGPIENHFDGIKRRFREMKTLPHWYGYLCDEGDTDWDVLKNIYLEHGWPDRYRKAECMVALENERAKSIAARAVDREKDGHTDTQPYSADGGLPLTNPTDEEFNSL